MVHPSIANPAVYPQQPTNLNGLGLALQQALERLAYQPPITVEAVDESTGEVRPWFTSSADDVLSLRLLVPDDLYALRARTGIELQRWWRAVAATKRVWQRRDTELRAWKAAQMVAAVTPPEGADEAEELAESIDPKKGKVVKKKGWTAPPQWVAEAKYRADPTYGRLNNQVERAEEAHNACLGVIDGWQAVARLIEALGG